MNITTNVTNVIIQSIIPSRAGPRLQAFHWVREQALDLEFRVWGLGCKAIKATHTPKAQILLTDFRKSFMSKLGKAALQEFPAGPAACNPTSKS